MSTAIIIEYQNIMGEMIINPGEVVEDESKKIITFIAWFPWVGDVRCADQS